MSDIELSHFLTEEEAEAQVRSKLKGSDNSPSATEKVGLFRRIVRNAIFFWHRQWHGILVSVITICLLISLCVKGFVMTNSPPASEGVKMKPYLQVPSQQVLT